MNFEEELTTQYSGIIAGETPGVQSVKSIGEEETRLKRLESDTAADSEWRASGNPAPYNYREAYAAGDTDLKTQPLPNKHFEKGAVNVAGYDLSTGEKYQQRVRIDDDGVIEIGAKRLAASQTRPGQDPPAEDVGALAHIAYGYVRDNKNYEEFDKAVPAQWSEKQRKMAWRAATDTSNQRRLEKHIENNMMTGEVKPAARAYEETIADAGFSASGRQIYKSFRGKEFQGSDIEASHWLASHLRDLDFNTVMQAAIVTRIKGADDKTLKAYGAALAQWDETEMERSVVAQLGNAGRMVLDPMNLAGAGIGKLTVVMAGRVAVKELLKRMAVGAVGGAIGGAVGEVARSQVTGSEVDTGKAAIAAGAGAAAGGVLSGAVPEALAAGGKMIGKGLDNLAKAKPSPMAGTPAAQIGSINPELKATLAAEQPTYDPATGFYSPALRAAEAIQQEKMTPAQAIASIKSTADVRQEELDWLGLEEAFKGKRSITKTELIDHIEQNRTQLVEKKIVGEPVDAFKWLEDNVPEYRVALSEYADANRRIAAMEQAGHAPDAPEMDELFARRNNASERVAELEMEHLDPEDMDYGVGGGRFKGYTVGGWGNSPQSNYQEVLLVNPRGPQQVGTEQHFGAQRGIVAWARTTDRERLDALGEPTGEKVRYVEEVQSDAHYDRNLAEKEWKLWQEEGVVDKNKSFDQFVWEAYVESYLIKGSDSAALARGWPDAWEDVPPSTRRAMMRDQDFWAEMKLEDSIRLPDEKTGKVTPREVVKKWPIATLKTALFGAARDGMDWLAWSPASIHQERWGKGPLVVEDKFVVKAMYDRHGKGKVVVQAGVGVPFNDMPIETFFKEYEKALPEGLAGKIHDAELEMKASGFGPRTIRLDKPVELSPGGYQMYDKEMVNEANKFLKRYGAKVERLEVSQDPNRLQNWGVKLTPEIRKKIVQGGVPLAVAGGTVIKKESNGDQTD
jgi:hypothetical protein